MLGFIKDKKAYMKLYEYREEVRKAEASLIEKEKILQTILQPLEIEFPFDTDATSLSQIDVDNAITKSNITTSFLKNKNQELIKSTETIRSYTQVQEVAYSNSVNIIKLVLPPKVIISKIQHLRILTISATELVHTRIFEDASRLSDIVTFDMALKKLIDVNTKNTQGLSSIDYATQYMFEYGIKALIERGSNSSGALLYVLHTDLPKAAKLLSTLTGKLVGYNEIFCKLQTDNIITHLDLSGVQLSPEGVVQLSFALTPNNHLILLNISNNNIGIVGAQALSKMLAVNHAIESIDISRGQIGFEGIKHIANALETNIIIKILKTSNNNLQEEGAIAISRLIEKNAFIINLDISSNNIMDIGAAYIVDRLSKNQTILRIGLEDNNITDDLAEDILETLQVNTSILIFKITANKFENSTALTIEEIIAQTTERNMQTLFTKDNIDDPYTIDLLAEMQQIEDF